jgi:hypothetical protein
VSASCAKEVYHAALELAQLEGEGQMIFRKHSDPVAELEGELARLRADRDGIAGKSEKAAHDLHLADAAQREALSSDNEAALIKIAGRRSVLVEIAAAAESALNDVGAQIGATEAALTAAREHADREKRASALETQAAALSPVFDQWLEVCDRFAQQLAKIHGVLDAQNAALAVRTCRDTLAGARGMLASEVQATAWQIRNPPVRAPEPPPLPLALTPRAIGDRLDIPHGPL